MAIFLEFYNSLYNCMHFHLYFFVSQANKRKLHLNIIYFSLSLLHSRKELIRAPENDSMLAFICLFFEEIIMFIKLTESATGKHP